MNRLITASIPPLALVSGLLFLQIGFAALAVNPPPSSRTAPIEQPKLSRELRAVGKVQYNETALATITSRVDCYVERLFVDYTGVQVKAGDHLVELYSPDLLLAQGWITPARCQESKIPTASSHQPGHEDEE